MSDGAREFNIKEVTFIKRLRSRWTPEQATGIDPPPEFKKGVAPIPKEEYIERLHLVHGDDLDFTHSDFNRAQNKVKVRGVLLMTDTQFSLQYQITYWEGGCPI